eukprot:GHVR01182275.1.p1 GENE.GHVR01182275.1~~GHVR01182275.1.p1  ORF type:complete len:192 (-),score=1.72 GHVR01182275.1:36-611(-)
MSEHDVHVNVLNVSTEDPAALQLDHQDREDARNVSSRASRPVRNRNPDIRYDSMIIREVGEEQDGSLSLSRQQVTRERARSISQSRYQGVDRAYRTSYPCDKPADISYYYDSELKRFLPKVLRPVPVARKEVSRHRVSQEDVSVRAPRDHSSRDSHGKKSVRQSRSQIPASRSVRVSPKLCDRRRQGSPPL